MSIKLFGAIGVVLATFLIAMCATLLILWRGRFEVDDMSADEWKTRARRLLWAMFGVVATCEALGAWLVTGWSLFP